MNFWSTLWKSKKNIFFLCLAISIFFSFFVGTPSFAALSEKKTLQERFQREKKREKSQRLALERLNKEERQLNSQLAQAEERLLAIEASIRDYHKKIEDLMEQNQSAAAEYELLLQQKKRIESDMENLVVFLWHISSRSLVGTIRELVDWSHVDREYIWSAALFQELEVFRKELDTQEEKLSKALGRKEKISTEIEEHLKRVNQEKQNLFASRVRYEQQLATIREKKQSAEESLQELLSLLESLQLEMDEFGVDMNDLRGSLPYPVAGRIVKKFAANAATPYRGVGFVTENNSPVRAVAPGIVVHNDVLRGLGHVVVLMHEEEYYSVYAFLENSSVLVGTRLKGEELLGRTGFYPALNDFGMYFELRFRQKAINPETWFKKK